MFLWLNSEDLAVKRVNTRVKEGGHDIPEMVIRRRYQNGLRNFFRLYQPIVDNWMFINNSGGLYELIAKHETSEIEVANNEIWTNLKKQYNG